MKIDIEILAGIVSNASFRQLCMSKLMPDCFAGEARAAFIGLKDMYENREPIDNMTSFIKLKPTVDLELLTEITTSNYLPKPTSWDTIILAKIEEYIRRDVTIYAEDLRFNANELDVFELINDMKDRVGSLENVITPTKEKELKDIIKETTDEIIQAGKADGIVGVQTGFRDLDKIFHGLKSGELIVVGGRPGMGKTTFATELARKATQNGADTLFFTMEMGEKELMKRVLSAESMVEHDNLISGMLSSYEWDQINTASGKILNSKLKIYNKGGINEMELATVCRKQAQEGKLDLVIVYYLQLISCSDPKKEVNLNMKAGYLSNFLKALAMELEVPIIVLSQLSRAPEIRGGDCRPIPSDLRDSGSIEQDANSIWFIYRPIFYGIQETEDGIDTRNYMELIIAKNRRGRTGSIPFDCHLKYMRLNDYGN